MIGFMPSHGGTLISVIKVDLGCGVTNAKWIPFLGGVQRGRPRVYFMLPLHKIVPFVSARLKILDTSLVFRICVLCRTGDSTFSRQATIMAFLHTLSLVPPICSLASVGSTAPYDFRTSTRLWRQNLTLPLSFAAPASKFPVYLSFIITPCQGLKRYSFQRDERRIQLFFSS